MRQQVSKTGFETGLTSRVGVMLPCYCRGDRFASFIWENFIKQTYPNKKLFVCRSERPEDQASSGDAQRARHWWKLKQAEHPDQLMYWEQKGSYSLGQKRNRILEEMLKPEHGCDYIATFDDDDVYSAAYLEVMVGILEADPQVQLVNFCDFLRIQTSGVPVGFEDPTVMEDGRLVQALEGSRAFLETLPGERASRKSRQSDKWYVNTSGGVLPSGFGFSFVYRASAVRGNGAEIRYGVTDERSGEEDVLYRGIENVFGPDAIVDLPISRSLPLAAHMENGHNISGDTSIFHFPSEHRVVIPRPLSFVPQEFLAFLGAHHPSKGTRNWAATVWELRSRRPTHRTLTWVANRQATRALVAVWQDRANWEPPRWRCQSPWFVPPPQEGDDAGQDIPAEAEVPDPPWYVPEEGVPIEHNPQRSLVVVPGSHLEYWDRAARQLKELQRRAQADPTIVVPKGHGVKIWETWARNSPQVTEYEQRARQLDLRSMCQGTSCILLWNSATAHQGTRSLEHGTKILEGAFVPPLIAPRVFAPSEVAEWRSHLASEGYVVLRDILGADMERFLAFLLEDIRRINPEAKLESLDDVEESHLGLSRRGLLYNLGFPHGKFAWAIRQDSRVREVWEALYETSAVMGSADVPALTRSEQGPTFVDSKSHDQWLHWDQNALEEPVGTQTMFQSMVYLFPEATSHIGGSTWDRIAMVLCMIPCSYGRSVLSEKTLLALAITGEASNHWPQLGNANCGWNGLRVEQIRNGTSREEIKALLAERSFSVEQMNQLGWSRLFPKLSPKLDDTELRGIVAILEGDSIPSTAGREELKERLGSLDYKRLRDGLSLTALRRIVHPQVRDYLGFVARE